MIDITLRINNIDFSNKLSKYEVQNVVETVDTVTTFDGTEHTASRERSIIVFSLIPLTESETKMFYQALAMTPAEVIYTNPAIDADLNAVFNVQTSINSAFALRSVTGDRYYKGSTITLREKYAR